MDELSILQSKLKNQGETLNYYKLEFENHQRESQIMIDELLKDTENLTNCLRDEKSATDSLKSYASYLKSYKKTPRSEILEYITELESQNAHFRKERDHAFESINEVNSSLMTAKSEIKSLEEQNFSMKNILFSTQSATETLEEMSDNLRITQKRNKMPRNSFISQEETENYQRIIRNSKNQISSFEEKEIH